MAGRRFEDATVDVGFGDPSSSEPEILVGPDFLAFAGIPPTSVPTIALEHHIAEKVHAYTRTYEGGPSSQVKDLADLAAIATQFPMDALRLRSAFVSVFDARRTHPLPAAFPPPAREWTIAYRQIAGELGLDGDVAAGFEQVRRYLDPVLAGDVRRGIRWDPLQAAWESSD